MPRLMGEDGISLLRAAPAHRPRNGQALVVGAGTGFNVCGVRHLPGGMISCQEAEEGHTSLPANIHASWPSGWAIWPCRASSRPRRPLRGGLKRMHEVLHGVAIDRAETISPPPPGRSAGRGNLSPVHRAVRPAAARTGAALLCHWTGCIWPVRSRDFAHRTQQPTVLFWQSPICGTSPKIPHCC